MPLSDAKFAAAFRRGAECYLREYGGRLARERTAHFWLAICLANELPRGSTHCIIGELHTRKRDLIPYLPDTAGARAVVESRGAFGYDLCISRNKDFDCRSFQTIIKEGDPDPTYTALSTMSIIAELKTGCSTATKADSIERDLLKLLAVARYAERWERRPKLFFIAAPGPTAQCAERICRDVAVARSRLSGLWPRDEEPEFIMQN